MGAAQAKEFVFRRRLLWRLDARDSALCACIKSLTNHFRRIVTGRIKHRFRYGLHGPGYYLPA